MVDPSGRVTAMLGDRRRSESRVDPERPVADALAAQLRALAAPTLFVRTGDWLGPAAALALALALAWGDPRWARSATAQAR